MDAWEYDLKEYIHNNYRLPCRYKHRRPGWFEYMDDLITAIGQNGNYLWRVDLDRNGNVKDSKVFTPLENDCMFIQGFKHKVQRQ